jgi:hypothetical protein
MTIPIKEAAAGTESYSALVGDCNHSSYNRPPLLLICCCSPLPSKKKKMKIVGVATLFVLIVVT